MPTVFDSICQWTRKTTTSFAELRFVPSQRDETPAAGDTLIYRLKHWPDLPSATKTAGVLRSLSVMSHRPVNRHWILNQSKLAPRQVDRLLQRLIEEGAVEVIDSARYRSDMPTAA